MKGNLLLPQTYDGGAIFMCAFFFSRVDAIEKIETCRSLDPYQLRTMRRRMEAAHRLRRIPAGGDSFLLSMTGDARINLAKAIRVDDSRLEYIWNKFRSRSADIVNVLSKTNFGAQAAWQLADYLCSNDARAAMAAYRQQYDRRRAGSDSVAKSLLRSILNSAVGNVGSGENRQLLQTLLLP